MKENYVGFVLHVQEWDAHGIPWGTKELVELAKRYNTSIPDFIKKRYGID